MYMEPPKHKGFTLIELLVVLTIVALLVSIAAPRYFNHIEHARENTLRQSLATVRDAIDKYEADSGFLPDTLEILVDKGYLRSIPKDPYTERNDSWVITPSTESSTGVQDIHSGASGYATDGTTPLGDL